MAGAAPLRVGVVGASLTGGWALQSHVPALRATAGVELYAVVTTRRDTAVRTAQRYGAVKAYWSVCDLTADPDVDLVTVAVKVPSHREAVLTAVAAGKDVYCEWPLGASTAEARTLRDAAAARGIRTAIGLQARLSPTLLWLRDLLHEGYVGRVLSVRAFSAGYGLGGPVLPADREWAAHRDGGLSVLSVRTAHTLDALQFCVGALVELSAEVVVATPSPVLAGTDRVVSKTAPDQVVITGRLAGGATMSAQFLLGVRPASTPLLTIMGTEGTVSVRTEDPQGQVQMSPLSLVGARGDDQPRLLVVPVAYRPLPDDVPAGPASAVACVYAAVRNHRAGTAAAPAGFDAAAGLHELLDVIERAAMTGSRQAVPPPTEAFTVAH